MSGDTWIVQPARPKGSISRLIFYLKSHPILFLLLLTPGIPEYLSASSNLTALVIFPPLFFAFLAANVGLYGSGVLLIREAMIRWKKGWATVFLLGAAYAILEEGIDLWTFFYSKAAPVGNLGYYGHWLGVNWVWTIGLVIFHSVYSIGLPIFLFGLAIPELKTKSLLSSLGVKIVMLTLIADSVGLFIFVSFIYSGYSPGGELILASAAAITVLIIAARNLPDNFLKTRSGQPKWSPFKSALVGALLFPATLFAGGLSAGANLPPEIPFVLDLFLALFILTKTFKAMGSANNQAQKVGFSVGLLFPIAVFGLIASIGQANLLIVAADILFVLFSRRLWHKWTWSLERSRVEPTLPPFTGGPSPMLQG